MVGMEAHGGGGRPLDGAAAPLPRLLAVIPVGRLGSGREGNGEKGLVCLQVCPETCSIPSAIHSSRWNLPVGYPKRSQPPVSASFANQRFSSA